MPEVRPPKDESWRTVTLPEARYCELMQAEQKAADAIANQQHLEVSLLEYRTLTGETAHSLANICYERELNPGETHASAIAAIKGALQRAEYEADRLKDEWERSRLSPLVSPESAAVSEPEHAVWTDYHRVPITKDDEAAAWKAAAAVEGTGEPKCPQCGDHRWVNIGSTTTTNDGGRYQCQCGFLYNWCPPAPAPPAEWKVVQRKDTAEWILEIAGPKLATQAEAEAAAAKVNGTCHHISTLQREHKQMAAEISRLKAELAAAEKDRDDLQFRIDSISE